MGFVGTHDSFFNRFGKFLGFLFSFSVFIFIGFNILFNRVFVFENIFLFLGAIIFLLAINFLLPKLFPKNGFVQSAKKGAAFFAKTVNLVVITIALALTYIFAVGFVAVVAKIFGKKFLSIGKTKKESFWISKKTVKNEKYYTEMF